MDVILKFPFSGENWTKNIIRKFDFRFFKSQTKLAPPDISSPDVNWSPLFLFFSGWPLQNCNLIGFEAAGRRTFQVLQTWIQSLSWWIQRQLQLNTFCMLNEKVQVQLTQAVPAGTNRVFASLWQCCFCGDKLRYGTGSGGRLLGVLASVKESYSNKAAAMAAMAPTISTTSPSDGAGSLNRYI